MRMGGVHGTVEGTCDVTAEGFNLRNDNDGGGGGDGGDDDDEDDDVDDDDECMTAEADGKGTQVLMDDELGGKGHCRRARRRPALCGDGVFVDAGLDELAYDETILAACVRERVPPGGLAWRDPGGGGAKGAAMGRVELVFKGGA